MACDAEAGGLNIEPFAISANTNISSNPPTVACLLLTFKHHPGEYYPGSFSPQDFNDDLRSI